MTSLMRAAVVLGGCLGGVACSHQASEPQRALAQPTAGGEARLCIAEARPGRADLGDPWTITVSSDGGFCSFTREGGGVYALAAPPAHGRLKQEARDGKIVLSYTPERGYVGADGFELRPPGQNIAMPYYIGVVP